MLYHFGVLVFAFEPTTQSLQDQIEKECGDFPREKIRKMLLFQCPEGPLLEQFTGLKRLDVYFTQPVAFPYRSFPPSLERLRFYYQTPSPQEGTVLHRSSLPSLLEIAGRRVVLLCKGMR